MVISKEHELSFGQLFSYIYKDDKVATKLSFDILHVLHVWDDLIDNDAVTHADINKAFLLSLVDIAGNPLWTSDMHAHLVNVYLRWNDANLIEAKKLSRNEIAKAWMLRAGLYDLFVLLAAKLHGIPWAEQIGITVREYYGEQLTDFITEVYDA